MKAVQIILAFIGTALLSNALQETKGWHGIVPLHSSRTDVEQLLGTLLSTSSDCSPDPGKCFYETEQDIVYIEYTKERCRGNPPGWNVPYGVVLTISVTPKVEQQFSDLHLDETKFAKTYDDTLTAYYMNDEEGLTYEVLESGVIHSITYRPSTKDNFLRCPGFPEVSGNTHVTPFDEYPDMSFSDETARLDNFAIRLEGVQGSRGYIIVYAGRVSHLNEARIRAECDKTYLVDKRNIDAGRVVAVDGGYREDLTIELYVILPGMAAPSPRPTIGLRDVKIIKDGQTRAPTRCSSDG